MIFTSGFFNKLSFIRRLVWRYFVYNFSQFRSQSLSITKVRATLHTHTHSAPTCVLRETGSFLEISSPKTDTWLIFAQFSHFLFSSDVMMDRFHSFAAGVCISDFVLVWAITYRYFCHCVLWETEPNVFIIDSSSSRLALWATDATVAAAIGTHTHTKTSAAVCVWVRIYNTCVSLCLSNSCVHKVCVCKLEFNYIYMCVCVCPVSHLCVQCDWPYSVQPFVVINLMCFFGADCTPECLQNRSVHSVWDTV